VTGPASAPTTNLPPVADLADAPPEFLPPVGPDHTKTPDAGSPLSPLGKSPPNTQQKPKSATSVLGKLGSNKKRASGVRALTAKDREKIERFYKTLSGATLMIRPKAARLMELSAEEAADTWMRWAEENDATRKWILTLLEGNTVLALAVIHLPIVLAFIPDSTWEKLPPLFMASHPDVIIAAKEAQLENVTGD
jgi:hypothetical protein